MNREELTNQLTSVRRIKELLRKYNLKPSKRLGQNFLINKNILFKIIEAGELKPHDIVLEIGPGIGILTQELAKRAKKVVAVEKDKKMCQILKENLSNFQNVEVINEDIRDYKISFKNYKVIANIPYYLTSFLIRKMLEYNNQPSLIVLLVQKEVAQRICAKPPKMNLLAVSVQFYAVPKIIKYVSKNSFWPQPKVDSAIIKIVPRPKEEIKDVDKDLFFKIVKAGFAHPRKTLVNNLSKELKLSKNINYQFFNNIKIENFRAEILSVNDWKKIVIGYSYFLHKNFFGDSF